MGIIYPRKQFQNKLIPFFMENNKLTLQEATQRMRQYPVLEKTLGEDWLAQEYKKEPKQQSLIMNPEN